MSYLDVNNLIKNLLEDSHNRKYQKMKITSSSTRNDLEPVKDGKKVQGNRNRKIRPNNIGEYDNIEDAHKASETNATLRQNLDNEKLNRIAKKRNLPIGVKNPKNPGIELGLYSIDNENNDTKFDYVQNYKKNNKDKNKTPIGYNVGAASNPTRRTLYTNKNMHRIDNINYGNEDLNKKVKDHVMLGKTKSENHETTHIKDALYVEKKHGKKAAREMELNSRMASYNANKAHKDYENAKTKEEKTKTEKAKDKAEYEYLHNPTEYNAHIVAANTKNHKDKNVVDRLYKMRHQILDKGVKGKKIPDIDDETLEKARNEQPI